MPLSEEEKKSRAQTVIDEYQGILPYFEAFYIDAIVYASERAVEAFASFDAAVAENDSKQRIVALAHEALTHTAALSRFFWPPRTNALANARAQKLRTAFSIGDESPLQSRELRNALEHFDERLDTFLLEDHVGYFFPTPMVDDASLSDEQIGHIFRLVDPISSEFVLLGRKYPFGEVRKIVEAVLERAQQTSGGRLR